MTAAAIPAPRVTQRQAFAAVLRRDLFVTGQELPVFLAQVILQPLFLLFVFGKVLASLGYTQHGYSDLLFPGLLALTAVITGMQTLAFPLVVEFGWTKEIEDRLRSHRVKNPLLIYRNEGASSGVAKSVALKTNSLGPAVGSKAPALSRRRAAWATCS